jgi:hypothetical protein
MWRWLVALALVALVAVPGSDAARGSSTDFSYTYKDKLEAPALNPPVYNYIPMQIVPTRTVHVFDPGLPLGTDEATPWIPIGFTFVYFGVPYTQLKIAVDGFITFGDPGTPGEQKVPKRMGTATNPDNMVAGYWNDMDPYNPFGPPGTISSGLTGTAPNRIFIADWERVYRNSNLAYTLTFQIQLHETKNTIEVHYRDTVNPGGNGIYHCGGCFDASLGIENAGATAYIDYVCCATSSPAYANHVVRYSPSPFGYDDVYPIVFETNTTIPASAGVLANDTDPDNDALAVDMTSVTTPANAKFFEMRADGSFTYHPNDGFIGVDTFEYKPHDGAGPAKNPARVTLIVADPVPIVIPPTPTPPSTSSAGASSRAAAPASSSSRSGAVAVQTGPADYDLDGIADIHDNCPYARNADQLDSDGDDRGDACDPIHGSNTEAAYQPVAVYNRAPGQYGDRPTVRTQAGDGGTAAEPAMALPVPQASGGVGSMGGLLLLAALLAFGVLLFFVLRPREADE